jgi:hypothetical protein
MKVVSFNSKMACATSGTGSAYPSREPEFSPGFNGIRVTKSLVFFL